MNEKNEGGANGDFKDWQAPKTEAEIIARIPEVKLAQIDEKDIPPPAKDVTIEEELETYRKMARERWQEKLKVDQENIVRESEGYVPPRKKDGRLDWPKVWKMLKQECPKRKEVFPNGEDKGLSDQEIERRLNRYFSDHDIPLWSMTGIDAREFPEIMDKDMRDLCLKANTLDWIRTKEGCTGHRDIIKKDGTTEPSDSGFQSPYLAVYLDRADARSAELERRMDELIAQIKEKYPFVLGRTEEFGLTDRDLEEKDIKTLNAGLHIDPSPEWKERVRQEKGQDYLDDVQVHPGDIEDEIITVTPKRPEEYQSEQEYADDYARRYRVFNYQRDLWHQYKDRYQAKHGDFFRSKQAENISKEFFAGIDRIINDIERGR